MKTISEGIKACSALAAAFILCGCAVSTIKDKMSPYIGQSASALFAKLGLPTRQDQVAGQKVYVWTTGQLIEGTNYGCTIRAIVNAQDIVTQWDGQGNEGGCASYASMLSR